MNIKQIIKQYFLKLQRIKFQRTREVLFFIQDYYLNKNNNQDIDIMYKKAREEIQSLGITAVELKNNTIKIKLLHPGLLIGRHRDNINNLTKELKHRTQKPDLKIEIEEDQILSWLLPYYSDSIL